MNIQNPLIISSLFACLVTGTAHAALQGRDLNGSAGSFEAYYDTALDITWLADANYAKTSGYDADGLLNWAEANTWAANLSFTDGDHVYDNWRLPTIEPVNGVSFNFSFALNGSTDKGYNVSEQGTAYAGSTGSEMAHLFYNTLNNPGNYTPEGTSRGCYTNGTSNTCLDNVGPFTNLQSDAYWSATGFAPNDSQAWSFFMFDGRQIDGSVAFYRHAWAVSPGDIAAVPEAQTYVLMLAGLGLIGWRARRHGNRVLNTNHRTQVTKI